MPKVEPVKLSIGSKIAAGFALSLAALLSISLLSYRNISELTEDSRLVTHTVEVLQRLESLSADMMQAQGAARGYVLAPESSFRDTFDAAAADLDQELAALRTLTADNPRQQDRLDKLQPAVALRLTLMRRLIGLDASAVPDKAAQVAAIVRDGQQKTDEIRDLTAQMETEERRLLAERQAQSANASRFTSSTITWGTTLVFLFVGGMGLMITRSITNPLQTLREGAARIGSGDYRHRVVVNSEDEVGELAAVFNRMCEQIQERQVSLAEREWLKTNLSHFSALFQGQRDLKALCQTVLAELATLLDARHSLLYVTHGSDDQPGLKLAAAYAADHPQESLAPGDGLVGQCVLEKRQIFLQRVPAEYLKIRSELGQAVPANIVVQPALFERRVLAVLELASFQPFTPIQLTFLAQLADSLGVTLNTLAAVQRTEELLRQSQSLTAELQTQTDRLRESEKLLQLQQEELKQSNEELEQTNEELRQTTEEVEEKANLMADQKKTVERSNRELEQARQLLEDKAKQLALTSKYKSEFLANMSHELRTPLNSLMILSKILEENASKNLTDKQVQYARTIYASGNDLLELINEILDLSKIESGTAEIDPNEIPFDELARYIEHTFRPVAESKKVALHIDFDPHLPPNINTDIRRLRQVLKNLLSNAFKFTKKGSVELRARLVVDGWDPECKSLTRAGRAIAFSVNDTGIGIPREKQQIIFEAFQQGEAGTNRRFGGTGLGLSISREIAKLLGGCIQLKSEPGVGSTFTLYLPPVPPRPEARPPDHPPAETAGAPKPSKPLARPETPATALPLRRTAAVPDDYENLRPGDLVLLIIEDDRNFAGLMVDFAREKRFKAVVASTAAEGVQLARQLKPAAITLDIKLPDSDGWMVLDSLKQGPDTRHIPVHVVTVDEVRERSLRLGAVSFLQKPVTKQAVDNALTEMIHFLNRPVKKLLVVEDVLVQRENIVALIGNGDVISTAVGTGADALAALAREQFDCVVLDLGLPDMGGTQLIEEIHRRFGHRAPPIIVYTSKELTREEELQLRKISESIVLKDVRSPERLLDETALFLHRVQSKLPEAKRRMIERVRSKDSVLSGRKVLIVDDDARNIFAITSALEAYDMQIVYAENGQAGIETLKQNPDVGAILMDVMMPEMDGFEAIRRIRQMDQFKKLPIISVTAKAMKGDREKCLAAGASDYITKPVDMDQLRSLLRVWLYA